jgi:RNA-binding protein Tab2/Atab2
MLDERGKKVWELLITDPEKSWVYARYFPNNKINSGELKAALKDILATPGAVKPQRVLFFRGQMATIISRAVEDMSIKAVPSRRCFALQALLDERLENVYKCDERFTPGTTSMFALDLAPPADIADALRGEQWAFVQLPLSALREEATAVTSGSAFGAPLPGLSALSIPDDTPVPGVAVFSRRAAPLAAWTNGLELACLKADTDRACLLLEAGVRDRYRYGAWRRSPAADEEARKWEAAKGKSSGLHFLAVQTDPDAESCAGLWLMRDVPLPGV